MCCREPSPVLLHEDRPTISCVPDNVLNPTNTTCVDVQHRPRMSYAGRYGSLCVSRLSSTKSPTRLAGSEGASGR